MQKIKSAIPGILLTVLVALPAWILGHQYPIIGAPIFSILFGMILHPFVKPQMPVLKQGITFSTKKLLQMAIILLGFQMDLSRVVKIGGDSLSVMVFTLSTAFIIAYVMGKVLKLDGKMTVLIGVGTSICGGSAIAATAPVIDANDEEIAHSISTIFLFNIIAVFIFPLIGQKLGFSDYGFGVFAGTAVNDTSSVVASATAWSLMSGTNTALITATVVKLTRTLMIVPITLFLSIVESRRHEGSGFNFSKVFPWFILGFLATTLFNTLFDLPSKELTTIGKYLIVVAMAGIGVNTNLVKLIRNGYKPLLLGSACWAGVTGVAIVVQHLFGIW